MSTPPRAPQEPQLSQLDLLQFKANKTTDKSLESTRRMVALCDESKEAGVKTLVALDEEGEQLENIEKGVDQIHSDMRESDKAIQRMDTCCFGLCGFLNFKKRKGQQKQWDTTTDGKPRSFLSEHSRMRLDDSGVRSYGGFIPKVNDDAREDEMESNVGQVSTMVGNMRNMAVDMGSEIQSQNEQLESINRKAGINEDLIQAGNKGARKLLNK